MAITSLFLGDGTVTVLAFASAFSWSVFFVFSSSAHFSAARCFFFSSLFFLRATCFCSLSATKSFFFLLAVHVRTVVVDAFTMLDVVNVVNVGEEGGMDELARGAEEPEQG